MTDFVMPILGADMEEGTLVEWRVARGDTVSKGDILAEVETDKGLIEVEGFTDGVVEELLVEPGTTVPVGTVLAHIRSETGDDHPPEAPPPRAGPPPPARAAPHEETAAPLAPRPQGGGRVRASPAARRLAEKLGVDLAAVRGTGPGGAVQSADVERASAPAHEAAPARTAPQASDRIRKTIAAAMARSKREIPHYYLAEAIDFENATQWLARANAERPAGKRLLPATLFLKATALALRDVPELNATWAEGGSIAREDVNVGVAISLRGGGLVAPAIHHTDRLPLDELMDRFRDVVARARRGSLRSSEYSDATITVTNLGDRGVEAVYGVIYPPQVAIVGFGRITERAWVVDGEVVPRNVVVATLSADHRVSDGHRGGLFLRAIGRYLQQPEDL